MWPSLTPAKKRVVLAVVRADVAVPLASGERREPQGDGRRPDSDSLPPQAATHSEGKGGGRRPAGPLRLP